MAIMKNKHLYTILSISVVFVFIMSLFSTVNVLADDSTPPAPTEAPVATDVPAATEEPVATEAPIATDEPIATEAPLATEIPAVAEDITIPNALAQLPEGTEVIILDQNGETLPLASTEAADILVNGDPQWCMDGYTPADDPTGGTYCTAKFSSFNGVGGLIAELTNFTGVDFGSGTIYVAYDYDATAAGDAAGGIIFNYAANALTNLTLQGGWDFSSNTVIGQSTFALDSGSSLEFWDWGGFGFPASLTLRDIIISGGGGLYIGNNSGPTTTTADVTLNNVDVNNTADGAYIRTYGGDVSVGGGSDFSDNDSDGVNIGAYSGSVTLDSTSASANNGAGAVISTSGGGDVSVSNSFFEDNNYEGLKIRTYDSGGSIQSGNVTLTNVIASSNNWDDDGYANANIKTHGGNVTITGSVFTYNYHDDGTSEWGGDGLDVYADAGGPSNDSGNITLNSVTANNNYDVGAYLASGCGCVTTTGSIFVGSSSFDHNGDFNTFNSDSRGLIAYSNGDITLASVSASANGGGGAELENCFPLTIGSSCTNTNLAQINISNSIFNNNGYNPPDISWLFGGSGGGPYGSVGLWAGSNGNITLNGITAQGNGFGDLGGGAFLLSEGGNLSISNSDFSGNCLYVCDAFGFGFIGLDFAGDVTLNGVTANGNGNDEFNDPSQGLGAIIFNFGGSTIVTNSNFNENCTLGDCLGGGLLLESLGNVYFDNVSASGNGTIAGVGVQIISDGNVDIYCSTFNNNASVGLLIDTSGDVTLNDVILSGNGIADSDILSASLSINPFNCDPKHKKDLPNLPVKVVNVSNGQSVELDCEHFSGTKLMLANDNSMTVPCPINDAASIVGSKIEDLPKPLPEGNTFLSAFNISVSQKGEKLGKLLDGYATISFVIPEDAEISKLAILFWDGSQWIEVKNTYVRNDPIAGKSYFEAYVTDMGTFVLVQK
jgi:hypothetical protein